MFKKIKVISMVAIMGIMLVACADKKETKTTEKVTETTEEATIETTEEATIETTEEVSEEVTDEKTEATSETDSAEGLVGNVYNGNGYSVELNDKWEVSSTGSVVDLTVMYTGGEGLYQSATNVGFQAVDNAGTGFDLETYGEAVIAQYESMDSVTLLSNGKSTFNGNDSYDLEVKMDSAGLLMHLKQIIMIKGDKIFIITIAAVDEEYDNVSEAVNELISTYKMN